MGVEHEADVVAAHRLGGGTDLLGKGSVLIVDQEGAIGAGRQAEVAAGTDHHVEPVTDLLGLDLDIVEVLGGEGRGQGQGEQRARSHLDRAHGHSPDGRGGRFGTAAGSVM